MHTYKETNTGWETGYYKRTADIGDVWIALAGFKVSSDAIAFTNYLNGGTGQAFVPR